MKTFKLVVVIFLVVVFNYSGKSQSGNVVLFESGFEAADFNATGWNRLSSSGVKSFHLKITDDAGKGEKSVCFSEIWSDGWAMAGIELSEAVVINPDNKYLLSFWYKTSAMPEYTLPFTVRFKVYRSKNKPLNYNKDISWSENQWQQVHLILENLPGDCDSVRIQIYTRLTLRGSIFIDDVVFKKASNDDLNKFEKWRIQELPDPLGKASSVSSKATGFYYLHKDKERWWFVKPDGTPTWMIGTMAAMPNNQENGNVELYNWYEKDLMGNGKYFSSMLFDTLRQWGFNSFAGWTSDNFAEITKERFDQGLDYFPMFRVIGLSAMGDKKNYYARDRLGRIKDGAHSFVDPFNPEWREDARQKAVQLIDQYKEQSWFAGWFVDNEIDFDDLFKFIWADYSANEFMKHLENKYTTIEKLNQSWSSHFKTCNYSSFVDILNEKPEPAHWTDPLYIDFTDFERVMVGEYINFTYNLIKELDPNHLVISNRINLGPMADLYRTIDLWGKYDLVCMNIYPENLKIGFSSGELELMKRLHEGTGKPIIIGEWSIPAISQKLYGFENDLYNRPLDWSWPQVVRSQEERGEAYHACLVQLSSFDFIVGAGWFKPIDVNSTVRRANRGLIDGEFKPYKHMIQSIKRTHQQVKSEMGI